MLVSFPKLPSDGKIKLLLISALIFSVFAALGVYVTLGSPLFFIFAILAALAQAVSELKGGYLRLPVALSALAFFLSVGQVPTDGALFSALFFTLGCFWGAFVAVCCIARTDKENPQAAVDLYHNKSQQRFSFSMAVTALIGSVLACISPGSHPCWLPAAALRVMKPTRQQTRYRMKARGLGSLLGAATGSLLLGLSPIPWLHASMVGGLVFAMLLIGAQRYAGWSFCLTAVALAFNLSPDGNVVVMAFNRVLLTVGGVFIAMLMLVILPTEQKW